MDNDRHSGDCTIYASMCNGTPTDGICTCGYGLRMSRKCDFQHQYSKEHPSYFDITEITEKDVEELNKFFGEKIDVNNAR
jgi:hypothetical protein